MTPQDRFLAYLRHYAAKDLDAIAAMLADGVVLRDWNLQVEGKAAALAETRKNFESARSIRIEPLRLHASANAVAGELRIVVDEAVELHVVDVLDFDAQGRIASIRAFLGRNPS